MARNSCKIAILLLLFVLTQTIHTSTNTYLYPEPYGVEKFMVECSGVEKSG
jgi:hypothetical protein